MSSWQPGGLGGEVQNVEIQEMTEKPRFEYPANFFADVAARGRQHMADLAENVGHKAGFGGLISADRTVSFSEEELEFLRKQCFSVRNMRAMILSACSTLLKKVPAQKRKSALVDWLFEREGKEWLEVLNSDEEDRPVSPEGSASR
jgi:hypothetical protein